MINNLNFSFSNKKKATHVDIKMPQNEKKSIVNIIQIQLAFFKKLIKVVPLDGNNIKPTDNDCFMATPQTLDSTTGIPSSDYHIYITHHITNKVQLWDS